jgi:hypothetical protein
MNRCNSSPKEAVRLPVVVRLSPSDDPVRSPPTSNVSSQEAQDSRRPAEGQRQTRPPSPPHPVPHPASVLSQRFDEQFRPCRPAPRPPGASSRAGQPCSGAAAPPGRVAPWAAAWRRRRSPVGHGVPDPVGPRARRVRGSPARPQLCGQLRGQDTSALAALGQACREDRRPRG